MIRLTLIIALSLPASYFVCTAQETSVLQIEKEDRKSRPAEWALNTAKEPLPAKMQTEGDTDANAHSGSGIRTIATGPVQVSALTDLGMLWGFIKYYHANVQDGKYNMDAELFRVLPKLLATTSRDESNKVLESWVDGFGKPEHCPNCKDTSSFDDIVLNPTTGSCLSRGILALRLSRN